MFSGRTINRPVIRIENDENSSEIFLTFIDPDRADTAMIFFIRPGWTRLRAFLASKREGDTGGGPLVYVSTKGDRDYAYAAWMLLDPNFKLIPREEYKGRIESVHKDRLKTFSSCIFGTSPENPVRDNSSRDKWVQMQDRIPFAIAIDDRDDVWIDKERFRDNWQVELLHKVAPYKPMSKKNRSFKESEELCQVLRVSEKAEDIVRGLLGELH